MSAEVGIGVSVDSADTHVYFPIELSEIWRIEPSIYYSNVDYSYPGSSRSNYKGTEFSLGVFRKHAINEDSRLYYGPRVGYVVNKNRYSSGYAYTNSKDKGYLLAAILGAEYLFSNKISLGAEIGVKYQNLDIDKYDDPSSSDGSYQYTENISRIIARFMF